MIKNRTKNILYFLILANLFNNSAQTFDTKEINYDTLASNPCTEHVQAFQCLFSLTKVSSFLEFGVGKGTKYFLDHCDHVTSLEISIASRADAIDPWYNECLESYVDYKNWRPLFYRASDVLDFHNRSTALKFWEQTQTYISYHLDEFQAEITSICNWVLSDTSYDVAFVDPGIFTRADFVNALFDHVDIIVAHDTHNNIYAWPRVINHPDYERIDHMSFYGGTSFWIKKTKEELITDLRRALEQSKTKI